MLILHSKIRKTFGKKVKNLRTDGLIPAILYGPEIKDFVLLEVNNKDFGKAYKEAGESSLISLGVQNGEIDKTTENFLVLIHNTEKDPLTGDLIHIDFYQPRMGEEIEVTVPIIFEGEAPAIKELGGTLVKNITEIEVKALPTNLPKEIIVQTDNLKTFEDRILVKDLPLPKDVKIQKDPEEIVALVAPLEKVEEELEKPIEEKVEEVTKVEKEKKESEEEATEEK